MPRVRVTMTVETNGEVDDVNTELEGALGFTDDLTLVEIESVVEVKQTREEMQAEAEKLMEEISDDE